MPGEKALRWPITKQRVEAMARVKKVRQRDSSQDKLASIRQVYLAKANRLNDEQLKSLETSIAADPESLQLRDELLFAFIPLTAYLSSRLVRSRPYLDYDEVIAEAMFVLTKATRLWDPSRGYRASTYIHNSIKRNLRVQFSRYTSQGCTVKLYLVRLLNYLNYYGKKWHDPEFFKQLQTEYPPLQRYRLELFLHADRISTMQLESFERLLSAATNCNTSEVVNPQRVDIPDSWLRTVGIDSGAWSSEAAIDFANDMQLALSWLEYQLGEERTREVSEFYNSSVSETCMTDAADALGVARQGIYKQIEWAQAAYAWFMLTFRGHSCGESDLAALKRRESVFSRVKKLHHAIYRKRHGIPEIAAVNAKLA